jgi:lysophospholipase L1-like esterase
VPPRPRVVGLALNLALSLLVTGVLLAGLEFGARGLEGKRPVSPRVEYLWDWEERWEGDFYTVGSNAAGWPPSQEWNADGLRDRAHSKDKLEGVWRVVMLGDSITLGAGIKASEAYPQVLESRLLAAGQAVEVLNVALWGWSTRQERIAYERLARPYHPDQVILGVCLNDLAELQNNLSRPPRWLAALHERSALARRILNARGREIASVEELFREPDAARVRRAYQLFFNELRALREAVRADGASFAIVVFPFRFQLEPGAPAPVVQQEIQQLCAKEGLRCLDVLEALRQAGPSGFVDYDHLSPSGSALAAETIAASGLVPNRPLDPALPKSADPVPQLMASLRDPQAATRVAAAHALAEHGNGAGPALPALFEALGDEREAVRWAAARAIDAIGVGSADAPVLEAALENGDAYVRAFAAYALGGLGEAAAGSVPALIEAYGREEREGRGTAVGALGQLGPLAKGAVPSLVEGLRNPNNHRRWATARALGRIGPEARAAVGPLIALLADPNEHVRAHAAQALGRIGVEAAAAVEALSAAAKDPDETVRREASNALKRIRGLPAAP